MEDIKTRIQKYKEAERLKKTSCRQVLSSLFLLSPCVVQISALVLIEYCNHITELEKIKVNNEQDRNKKSSSIS
jgi:hypothetical protein